MLLLNPHRHDRPYPDTTSRDIMRKTIAFFEERGKTQLKADYHAKTWYSDFLDFIKREKVFATLLTPAKEAPDGTAHSDAVRWDTWRLCEFAEILAFYGLEYWYTFQVTVLGLGPLWMTDNDGMRAKTTAMLQEGGIFAFGLSEKEHGADIYSSSMTLTRASDAAVHANANKASASDGGAGDSAGAAAYRANGHKYYIGNGNKAAIVSTFGKMADSGDYVFFATHPQAKGYGLIQKVTHSESYVAEFALNNTPVAASDVLATGQQAWDNALNTVNIGKYNLGWASIGICTHAFYESINHAANRRLYNMAVTDFPHVQRMLVDAYARLNAMKLFALRAADYMRSASAEDRRYLLFNPMVKMKVTTEGETVINLLWDVIAAKGFEKDTYFEQAALGIRALPKLEGTVHVNIALIAKFMANYFFNPKAYPEVPRRDDGADDAFLFAQGTTRGLSKIQFHDFRPVFENSTLPNVKAFYEQVQVFQKLLMTATPNEEQRKDIDFLMAIGDLFALVVYAQLVLENAPIYNQSDDLIDTFFDCLVRDMSERALTLHNRSSATEAQMILCRDMLRRPEPNPKRFGRMCKEVLSYNGAYAMQA